MIGNIANKIRYSVLSITPLSSYDIPFKFWDSSQISVFITSAEGIESEVSDSNFTVSSPGETGTISFTAGYSFPEDTSILTIVRTVDIEQLTDYRDGDILPADVLEKSFDVTVALLQQINEKLARTIAIPISDPDASLEIPSSLIRSNMLLGFDGDGSIIPILTTDIEQNLTQALAAEESVSEMYEDAGMAAVRTDMAVSETSKIQAVANNKTNIDTVASDISNVNSVAGNITNVNQVAGNATNINAVNANKVNVDTVATDLQLGATSLIKKTSDNILNVNAVAGNETNINAVNANKTNIDAVAGNSANINNVAGNKTNVDIVAGINSAISTVAADGADIGIVSTDLALGGSSNIKIVAADKSNIDSVAGNASNINSVAGNETNINAVAGNQSNINTVAGINTAISTVAGSDNEVVIVATDLALGESSNVKIVSDSIEAVSAVAAIDDEVAAVAGKTVEITALYAQLETIAEKVNISSIVDALTSSLTDVPLSANQGKVLAEQISDIVTSKAVADGIATLGSDGKIPSAQIPSLALVDVFPVASQAEMLALDAEQGDMAVRTDSSQVFILSTSPASTLENWVELAILEGLIDSKIAEVKADLSQESKRSIDKDNEHDAQIELQKEQMKDVVGATYNGEDYYAESSVNIVGEGYTDAGVAKTPISALVKQAPVDPTYKGKIGNNLVANTDFEQGYIDSSGVNVETSIWLNRARTIDKISCSVADKIYISINESGNGTNDIKATSIFYYLSDVYVTKETIGLDSAIVTIPSGVNQYRITFANYDSGDTIISTDFDLTLLEGAVTFQNITDLGLTAYDATYLAKYFETSLPYGLSHVKPFGVENVGKNLMPLATGGFTANGITATANADGSITLNGTATATTRIVIVNEMRSASSLANSVQDKAFFNVKGDGAISLHVVSGTLTGSGESQRIYITNDGGSEYKYTTVLADTTELLVSETGDTVDFSNGIWGIYISCVSGRGFSNFTFNTQAELSTVATDYEERKSNISTCPYDLYRLPNGTSDTWNPKAGEYVKRVSDGVAVASGVAVNTTNYPLAKSAGSFINEFDAGGIEVGVIGTDSTTGAGTLYYELSTPITTTDTPQQPIVYEGGSRNVYGYFADSDISDSDGKITLREIPTSYEFYGYDEDGEYLLVEDTDYSLSEAELTLIPATENVVVYYKEWYSTLIPTEFMEIPVENLVSRIEAIEAKVGTAVTDATDTSDVVAQLNALLASLRTAGVITT